MSDSEELLDCLLSAVEEDNSVKPFTDDPNFLIEKETENIAIVHKGDTDSSEDEDNREYQNAKYNDYGKSIKHLLASQVSDTASSIDSDLSSLESNTIVVPEPDKNTSVAPDRNALRAPTTSSSNSSNQSFVKDVYTDPIFGIRIIKPLISSALLVERMKGREAVSMSRIKKYTENVSPQADWVIAGVITSKTSKKSQAGKSYAIWNLSDLHGDIKNVVIFIFGSAYKELWKCSLGTVVGILNPTVFNKKADSTCEAALSVTNAQKVMIFGQSKDYGVCKSVKKNGDPCSVVVNKNRCEYCLYHIKQEYQKCSNRSELQANFAGRGLQSLRNKVLGKNEVFYAGKSFRAIPAGKSKKLAERDKGILGLLSNGVNNSNNIVTAKHVKKQAAHIDSSVSQRLKDLELIKKLKTPKNSEGTVVEPNKVNEKVSTIVEPTIVTTDQSKSAALSVIAKLKAKNGDKFNPSNIKENKTNSVDINKTNKAPVLLNFGKKLIDFGGSTTHPRAKVAKMNALNYIQKNGPIKKSNPNDVKKAKGLKRHVDIEEISDAKRVKIQENEFFSERFKKMIAATSKHTDLLEQYDDEQKEKYFDKLERKERMEDKMMSTFKIACKAVKCLVCKYTSFSAAEKCKTERHALKVYDAFKRFFKCGDCGNRTVTLDVIPILSCKNCGSGRWERSTMMKEKSVTSAHTLSIRGGEQTFTNSVATDANINLLVPE